jgi:sodium/potassium-transporting ATPase subunit alpha
VFEIPFNSRYKYNLSLHKLSATFLKELNSSSSETHLCIIKGAPEVIAEMCAYGFNDNRIDSFDSVKSFFLDKAHNLAAIGERVLGVAYALVTINGDITDIYSENNLPNNFCFYGLLSLIDPPRIGVADAVTKCHNGFIKVLMVTGD